MAPIKITTNLHGELTSSSHHKIHSFLKSVSGPFGPVLADAALPKIKSELKSRAATVRQDRVRPAPTVYTNSYGATVVRLPPSFIAALRARQEGGKPAPRFISLFK